MDDENSNMEVDQALDLRVESRRALPCHQELNHSNHEPKRQFVRVRRAIPSLFEVLVSPEGAIDHDTTDVEFRCKNGQVVKGHRIVLALSSTFFTAFFKYHDVDQKTTVFVPNASAEAITNVLELCYKPKVILHSEEQVREVVYWLKQFGFNQNSIDGVERFWPSDESLCRKPKLPSLPSMVQDLDGTNSQIGAHETPMDLSGSGEQDSQLPEAITTREQDGQLPQVEEVDKKDKVTYWLAVADAHTSKPRILNRESDLLPGYSEEDTATYWFGDLSVTKTYRPLPLSSADSEEKSTSRYNSGDHQDGKPCHPVDHSSSTMSSLFARNPQGLSSAANKFPVMKALLDKPVTSATIKTAATAIQKIRKSRQQRIPSESTKNIRENDNKDQERIRWVYGCHVCKASFSSFVKSYEHWTESRECNTVPYQTAFFKYRQGAFGRYRCPLCTKHYPSLYSFSIHCLHKHPEYKKLLTHVISEDKIGCLTCHFKFVGPTEFHNHLGPDMACHGPPK